MSLAWETTTDDLMLVLGTHKVTDATVLVKAKAALDGNEDRIEDAAMCYTDFDHQTASALDEIESLLIEEGVLKGPKRYTAP